ncbi:hypothetical protein BT96DRAFT_942238 [Gymnopus androsaceus JB14]|uniref:Uncharacterized protein n=1 Tax=Gymnopus androsaceus JB14 TaxID=1447944 RepID=A0A6A4HCL4_9AGAR|nr:hypothetical protein BT96DRAFT_942238 [Gymnopus androsaceus JB14]
MFKYPFTFVHTILLLVSTRLGLSVAGAAPSLTGFNPSISGHYNANDEHWALVINAVHGFDTAVIPDKYRQDDNLLAGSLIIMRRKMQVSIVRMTFGVQGKNFKVLVDLNTSSHHRLEEVIPDMPKKFLERRRATMIRCKEGIQLYGRYSG